MAGKTLAKPVSKTGSKRNPERRGPSTPVLKRWLILIATVSVFIGTGVYIQKCQVAQAGAAALPMRPTGMRRPVSFEKQKRSTSSISRSCPTTLRRRSNMLICSRNSRHRPPVRRRRSRFMAAFSVVFPGERTSRRRQMELKFSMGRLRDDGAIADLNILLQTPSNKNDGNLLYMMGRCCDEIRDDVKAKEYYGKAIDNDAPQKIEAYQRLAAILADPDRLKDRAAADQTIEEMVRSSPENYVVYVERGRYRRQFRLPGSKADFEKALKLADNKPEIYLELARIAEAQDGNDAAEKSLEAGLHKSPTSSELYKDLADLLQRSNHLDQAIDVLEKGLKSSADNRTGLRWLLANFLAFRGDTGKLWLQIEELKNMGFRRSPSISDSAHYYVNSSEFRKAKQVLLQLESVAGLRPELKARVNNLLARCYSQLGEQRMQQEAYLRALSANPQDVQAKLGLVDRMIKQGEIEEAIKEYRSLAKVVPRISIQLAQLLIAWNLQRPPAQRDWKDIETVLDDAAKKFPELPDPLILRGECTHGAGKARPCLRRDSKRQEHDFQRMRRCGARKPT